MTLQIGDSLRARSEYILNAREEEKRKKEEKVARPFISELHAMVRNIDELDSNCNKSEYNEVVIGRRLLVGVFGIAGEYDSELILLEREQRLQGIIDSNRLIDEFIQKIFENFKNAGGGMALKDYCDRENLGVEFTLLPEGTIQCYVTWYDLNSNQTEGT